MSNINVLGIGKSFIHGCNTSLKVNIGWTQILPFFFFFFFNPNITRTSSVEDVADSIVSPSAVRAPNFILLSKLYLHICVALGVNWKKFTRGKFALFAPLRPLPGVSGPWAWAVVHRDRKWLPADRRWESTDRKWRPADRKWQPADRKCQSADREWQSSGRKRQTEATFSGQEVTVGREEVKVCAERLGATSTENKIAAFFFFFCGDTPLRGPCPPLQGEVQHVRPLLAPYVAIRTWVLLIRIRYDGCQDQKAVKARLY